MIPRERSKSCSTNTVHRNVLASYAKYPNFKWRHLKYFGVDPAEFLASKYNIDLDTINENPSDAGKVDPINDTFGSMRRRSQSFNTKRMSKPSNEIGKREQQNGFVYLKSKSADVGMFFTFFHPHLIKFTFYLTIFTPILLN